MSRLEPWQWLAVIVVALVVYFIPSIVAYVREHHNRLAILAERSAQTPRLTMVETVLTWPLTRSRAEICHEGRLLAAFFVVAEV
jgi:hypothetical protein